MGWLDDEETHGFQHLMRATDTIFADSAIIHYESYVMMKELHVITHQPVLSSLTQ